MANQIKNISLIFSENPVGRAYLYLFIKKNLISNEIIYLNQKTIFNNFFLKLNHNIVFRNTKKYLKSSNVLTLIRNIEEYFELDNNFLINIYNFENILKFENLKFVNKKDINNDLNIKFFKDLKENNFLNTSNVIFKNIFNSNKNFYHIHPGYMYKVRGCDGTLNSINRFNKIGASFFLMDNKIDNGKILSRFEKEFKKLNFPKHAEFNVFDLYNIWFSFFDPALRVSLLNKLLDENISLDNFENINVNDEQNNYFTFIKKDQLKDLFLDKIFADIK